MGYEIHFAVELPFWMALDDGSYDVRVDGETMRVNLSNHIARIDIGDFYSGQGARGSQWVHENDAETTRRFLQDAHPQQPITRQQPLTVITHVRAIDAPGESSVLSDYQASREHWYEQTLRVFNKFILSYLIVTHQGGLASDVGAVDSWDLGGLLVSFWERGRDDPQPRQFGGYYELVRARTPPPAPVDDDVASEISELMKSPGELPIVDVLHASAESQRRRGAYRSAIIDDVSAMELEAESHFVELAQATLPSAAIDSIVRRYAEVQRWTRYLGGRALTVSPMAPEVKEARDIRHRINHRGASATDAVAAQVHRTVYLAIRWLRGS